MTYLLIVSLRRQGVTDVTCEFMAHPGYPTKLTPENQHDALLIGMLVYVYPRKSYNFGHTFWCLACTRVSSLPFFLLLVNDVSCCY